MMLMLMLILILTADVDAGFYDFGIKGVGWSAFSEGLGLALSDLSLSC